MIWTINELDAEFIAAWEPAGTPDQGAIDRHLAKSGKKQHAQAERNQGEPRYYYLLKSDPRIRLSSVGTTLDQWEGKAAKVIVGTGEIIGEFAGNRHLIGQLGLRLQMEPIGKLIGRPDETFACGLDALLAISEQIINREQIERSQREITQHYHWNEPRFRGTTRRPDW